MALRAAARPVGTVAVLLVNVLACLIALGFLWTYRATLKQLLIHTADVFDSVSVGAFGRSVKPFGSVAALFRWMAAEIDHRLAQLVTLTEGSVVYLWDNLTGQLADFMAAFYELGEAVADALDRLTTTTIPNSLAGVERRVADRLAALRARADSLYWQATVVLPGRIGRLGGRVGSLERWIRGQAARVRSIERATVGVGAAALVGLALGRIGLGWIRCRNVSKLGRGVCRSPVDLLDAILAGALLVYGTYSLVEFAREMQDVTEEVAPLIRAAFREG